MIHNRSLVSEATLEVGNKVVGFNKSNQPFVDHTLHGFAKAAYKWYWAVAFWIEAVFHCFGYRDDS